MYIFVLGLHSSVQKSLFSLKLMARGVGLLLTATFIISYLYCTALTLALPSHSYFPKNVTTTWKNDDKSFPGTIRFSDGSFARFILVQKIVQRFSGTVVADFFGFGFCFYCKNSTANSCYLSNVFIEMNGTEIADAAPVIVWSANRDRPMGESSTLSFTVGGGLVLKDSDGNPIWSTNTSSSDPSAIGMSIREGNLMLLNETNGTVWQSFDHPTDTLLLGQRFKNGQLLTSSKSSVDMSSGLFYLFAESVGLSAYLAGKNNSHYASLIPFESKHEPKRLGNLTHIEYGYGHIYFFYQDFKVPKKFTPEIGIPMSEYIQLLRLDADGALRIHQWEPRNGWEPVDPEFDAWRECQAPLKCGRYGVCRKDACKCPVAADGTDFFAHSQYPSDGCHQINDPALQEGTNYRYQLQNFGHLSYFSYFDKQGSTPGSENEESCKQACLSQDTSCMAAFFLYSNTDARGYCYLVSEVLSIIGDPMPSLDYYTSAHIKVKVKIPSTSHGSNPVPTSTKFRILSIASATCACLLLCIFVSLLLVRRKKNLKYKLYLQKLSETLFRFSHSELSMATQNFSQKLGGGGFGLVFKGALKDGRVVAVKRLRNDGQGKKEFLAEVETVGKIHHINLIKLIGFCAENKHFILVYEYMSNGSLEKWIFHGNQNSSLDWEVRKNVVLDVAKGLAYIHEECRQRIAHLDIKPHNILLDDNFNAKISDFGMSKLISRDESQVVTEMRGTLGYLAPEWQESRISVKADVYSFGILLLEIVSGRKILDYSQPESDVHLLKLLKKKSLDNRLMDIVDSKCEGVVSNCEDVVQKIELAMWCLHSDYKRRPAMSSVVKVLEGSLELEPNITYNFSSVFSPVG